MSEFREQCRLLLEQVPENDLAQVLEELQSILDFNTQAASYVFSPPPPVKPKVSIPVVGCRKASPIVVWMDDDE